MKATLYLLSILFYMPLPSFAAEIAPRITDREIVERLARLDARMDGLEKRLEEGHAAPNKRIDDLRSEMSGRFDAINGRLDTLQWTQGLFVTISLIILGFVLRLQWQMTRRQAQVEITLETHKDEIAFLKGLIEKLLPPRGSL
jgi:hypothetical protein